MRPAIEICVDSRAPLVPMASLMTCTVSVWPSKTRFSIGTCGASLWRGPVAARVVQVGHVQEGRALEPDVDEGALHARQHARHLAQVDVADQAALERALEVELLQRAVLDHGHARLLRRPVDEDVLAGHGSGVSVGRQPARASSAAVSNSGSPMIPEWLPSMRSIQAASAPWIA